MIRRPPSVTIALYIVGIATGVVILAPLFWLLLLSLKTPLDAFAVPPLLVFEPTGQNYQQILADPVFLRAIGNSLIVSVGSVLASLLLALPAAFGLTNLKGRIRRNLLLWVLVLRMVPGMVYLIPYFVIFNQLDLLDTHIGLIIVYLIFNVPLIIWMLLPAWNAIPRELEESAFIDGATPLQVLLRIDMPLLRSAIIASAILAFIFSWNEFLFALILTRRQTITLPVAIVNYMAYEGTEWGKIGAASVMVMAPVIVFGFAIRRYMVSGLTAGAVKG